MMRWPSLVLSLFLVVATAANGQESALFSHDFFNTRLATRYEQGPAVFRYVIPCKQFSGIGADSEPAICWPVSAQRLRLIDGKFDFTPPIPGTLTISATKMQFIPTEAQSMEYARTVPIAQVEFKHDSSALTGMIGSGDTFYRFTFNNYCEDCHPGGMVLDPAKTDQLNGEFANVSESVKHFDAVYSRVSNLARQIRFTVSPANQPSVSDVHAAMRLYSNLNHSLAAACPAAASACIRSYETYQACETGAPPVNCGPPPSCTAVCTLQPETTPPHPSHDADQV